MTDTSYDVIATEGRAPIKLWTRGVPVEESAQTQLRNLAAMPFVFKHVAVMPDVHWGMGATVGSVIATKGAIIPAAVGVDIGCGMEAMQTGFTANDLPDNLAGLRTAIEVAVPHGRTDNGGPNDKGAWGQDVVTHIASHGQDLDVLNKRLDAIVAKHPKLGRSATRASRHAGTLGTGNHFIELCLDENNNVWIMLHSGSRGIGNAIGAYFIELAKQDMQRWFINLPDADLAYIPEGSILFKDYFDALMWAQEFAALNRKIMLEAVRRCVASTLDPKQSRPAISEQSVVSCHHNYVAWENHFNENVMVTRKGAVRARLGDLGIIPGSMGAKSFIVSGKGNAESFDSCSHGAGRAMGRKEAKRRFTVADHIKATAGVECRKDAEVVDETPEAYKSIDAVMAAQSALVDIVHTLKQVVCVKG